MLAALLVPFSLFVAEGVVVQNLNIVHELAAQGNLTRVVHVKLAPTPNQKSVLARVISLFTDEGDPSSGRRRRLTGVEQPERLFPHAGKHEKKHVAYGLDRWYKINVATAEDDAIEAGLAVEEALTRIDNDAASRQAIEYAEAHPRMTGLPPPDNPAPRDENQDFYDAINLNEAREITTGSSDVLVAVIDSGMNVNHPNLKRNVWKNKGEICDNGIDDDNNGYVDDCNGVNFVNYGDDLLGGIWLGEDHGTHCSGIIAAHTRNGNGVPGIAGGDGSSGGVKILTATIVDDEGESYTADIHRAIVYSADMKAQIISNSWRYSYWEVRGNHILDAIDYATDAGSIFVAASNGDKQERHLPSHYHKAVSVAALHNNGTRYWRTGYGYSVDIAAPGVDIYSTFRSGYGYKSGASMASSVVVGVLALGFSANPGLSNDAALDCLYSTAAEIDSINPGFENLLGAGMVDAYAFVQCAVAGTHSPTSAPQDPTSLSCDFEDSYLCGWDTGNSNGIAWLHSKSATPRGKSLQGSDGHYLFADADVPIFAEPVIGPFELISPVFDTGREDFAISFDYAFVEPYGSLSLQYEDAEYSEWVSIWATSAVRGNKWLNVRDLRMPKFAQRLRFESSIEPQYGDDFAQLNYICVDNVIISAASTTPEPEQECIRIVDGNPSVDSISACPAYADFGREDSIIARKSARVAGTFCCGGGQAYCENDCEVVDFETAQATCLAQGSRLCTESELLAGAAIGSDCGLDYMHVWSSTPAVCPDTSSNITAMVAECVAGRIADYFPDHACKKSCAGVVDGDPNHDIENFCFKLADAGLDDYLVRDANSGAGVRCCGDNGEKPVSLCEKRHCDASATYEDAVSKCEGIGMRLCTAAEVLNGDVKGTGCSYDFMHVWVGERVECHDCASIVDGNPDVDSSTICDMSPDEGLQDALVARKDSAAAGVRCCSYDGSRAESFCDYDCQRIDYNSAKSRCEEADMRLCTREEILEGAAAGDDCSYDFMHVWSVESTICSENLFLAASTAVCVVDGNPEVDGNRGKCLGVDVGTVDFKLVDPARDLAAIRCCNDFGPGKSICPNQGCELFDYQTAKDECAKINMRLCTAEEILDGKTKGTGCLNDYTYVWSSSEGSCSPDQDTEEALLDHGLLVQECIEEAEATVKCNA